MKGREKKKLLSLLKTGKVCRDNIAIICLLPGMLRSVKKYDQLLLDLLESMYGQKEIITHHAKEKLDVRIRLAEHADYVSSLAYAYAYSIKSNQLMMQFKQSYSGIYRSRDTDVVPVCMYIYKGLVEQQDKVKDWGIKKKDTEELLTLIKNFEKLMTVPGSYITRRSVQTKNLRERLGDAGKILMEETDNLLKFFKPYPEFTEAYNVSRKQPPNPLKGRKERVTDLELEKMVMEFYLAPKMPRGRKKASTNPDKYPDRSRQAGTGTNHYESTNQGDVQVEKIYGTD